MVGTDGDAGQFGTGAEAGQLQQHAGELVLERGHSGEVDDVLRERRAHGLAEPERHPAGRAPQQVDQVGVGPVGAAQLRDPPGVAVPEGAQAVEATGETGLEGVARGERPRQHREHAVRLMADSQAVEGTAAADVGGEVGEGEQSAVADETSGRSI